jgi:hypothetical protein
MKFVIVKASDDYWRRIKEFKNLKDLLKYREKMGDDLIISDNHWKGEDPVDIMRFLRIEDIEIAKEISEIDYEIEIYDDYIE